MVDTADRTRDPAPPAAGYGWRRWTALGVLSLCVLVPLMDLTMVSVALSAIGRDLHADTAQLQWIISGYILVTALFMPVASVIGGRVGYRRTLLCGLALFGAASAAGALAPNAQLLVATRLVMGLGASTVLPMMMALFGLLFRPEELRRAIGVAVGAVAVANPFGPVIAGVLVDGLSWDWIFLINVILVALALPLIRWLLPGARNPLPQTADLASLLLLAAGSSTAIYGIVRAGEGWSRPPALAWTAVGLALLAGFVLRQRSAARPLVPYVLFSTPRYLWSQAMLTVANSAWAGMLFAAPLYLIEVLGCSTIGVGLRLLPGGLLALGATRLGEWLNKRTSARVIVIGGLVVFGGSLLLLAYGISRADDVVITTAITTASMAGALPQAAALETAMSTLPADYAVSGGAFVNAFRHLGGAFGAALAGSVAMAGYVAALPGTASHAARFSLAAESAGAHALGHGMSTAVTVAAASLLATALLALLLPGRDDAVGGAVGG